MGLHNRITEHKYNQIKTSIKHLQPQYETVADLDQAICGLYGVGVSTAHNIRLTGGYQEYCERVFRFHGHPGKKKQSIAKESKTNQNDEHYLELLWAVEKRLSSIASLCMQLDGDHQAIIENQLNISRKLRIYTILDCVLIFVMAATIALLAWRIYGN